jgi:hypothetical protein
MKVLRRLRVLNGLGNLHRIEHEIGMGQFQ